MVVAFHPHLAAPDGDLRMTVQPHRLRQEQPLACLRDPELPAPQYLVALGVIDDRLVNGANRRPQVSLTIDQCDRHRRSHQDQPDTVTRARL